MKKLIIALVVVLAAIILGETAIAEEPISIPTTPEKIRIKEELLTNFIKINQCLANLELTIKADQRQYITWLSQIIDDPLVCDVDDPVLRIDTLIDYTDTLKAMATDLKILTLGDVALTIRRSELITLYKSFESCTPKVFIVAERNRVKIAVNEFLCVLDLWGKCRKDVIEKFSIQLP